MATYEELCKLKPGDKVVCRVKRVDKEITRAVVVIEDGGFGHRHLLNEHVELYTPPEGATYDREAFLRELIVSISTDQELGTESVQKTAEIQRARYEHYLAKQAAQEDK